MTLDTDIQTTDLLNLLEKNKQLITSGERSKLLNFILDEAIRLSGAERGFIILKDEKSLTPVAARNIDKEAIKQAQKKYSKTAITQVMETGEPLIVMDAAQDKKLKQAKSVMEMKLRSILCVPMHVSDEPLGALYLDNRFTEGAFQEKQVRIVHLFADQAALALSALDALDQSRNHAAELDRLQQQLAAFNEELQDKVQSAERERDDAITRLGQEPLHKDFPGIIGQSKALRQVLRTIRQFKDSEVPVYIHGESGTGKELIARAIHANSPRRGKSFYAINCAAFSEQLLDSELFGHVRGAFTGAERDHKGLFEEADGGTFFLDEVGEMSPSMQGKLLRAIQEKEIRPVGSNRPKKVDVRIVSASNKDLQQIMKEGAFREDLYYRLNVVRLDLPPLRERKEDIPDLIRHFLRTNDIGIPQDFLGIEEEAMQLLANYNWPGNIRELQNEIHRALALGKGEVTAKLLSPEIREARHDWDNATSTRKLDPALKAFEKHLILRALDSHQGNKKQAAEQLGISRARLYQKISEHGLSAQHGRLTIRQLRQALREARGNKALAARRLGIGRRTLYDRLKKLGEI